MNDGADGATHPRALLAAWGLRPQKKYGQNFLMDMGAARRIARLSLTGAPPEPRVLEIGAGTGQLTAALLEAGATVTALEIDPALVALLNGRAELRRAAIVHADALTFDYESYAAAGEWHVAANLPYNVATPLITRLAEMARGPQSMVVMIQKDVAQRIAASPGTAAYGSLSVAIQYAMRVFRGFDLRPGAFYPPPNIQSSVVRLERLASPAVEVRDVEIFRKVVRAAFAYRRKTLANSLALALNVERTSIAAAIAAAHLKPEIRGEQLSIGEFARLADALAAA